MIELEQNEIRFNKKFWIKDALAKSTPVARRWAAEKIKNGEDFADFEEDFLELSLIEEKLYTNMKETLAHHIRLHGLDDDAKEFFEEFLKANFYNRHSCEKILKKISRAYIESNGKRSFEYLISKINEYLKKVKDFGDVAYRMLQEGKKPDLEAWSDKVMLQDAIFEENKQFLKQTLNHLQALNKNHCVMGVAEIRMLLYHKEGCRREKLYCQVENWIINIYNSLPDDKLRRSVYPEICQFVDKLVPQVGYISPTMIGFIFDRGFLSKDSRDLLIGIHDTILKLGMSALVIYPLVSFYRQTKCYIVNGLQLSKSDEYVWEIMKLYCPKNLTPEMIARYEAYKKGEDFVPSSDLSMDDNEDISLS